MSNSGGGSGTNQGLAVILDESFDKSNAKHEGLKDKTRELIKKYQLSTEEALRVPIFQERLYAKGYTDMVADHVLVKFLHAREFHVERAVQLYHTYMNNFGDVQRYAVDIMDALTHGALLLPGTRDLEKSEVFVFASKLATTAGSELSYAAIFEMACYLLDVATANPVTQRYGITCIIDLSTASWKQFDASLQSQLLNLMEEKYPVRLKKVLVVNAPWWISMIMKAYKAVMSAGVAAKLEVVDNAGLTKYIDSACIIAELGGTFQYSNDLFISTRMAAEADELTQDNRAGYVWQLVKTPHSTEIASMSEDLTQQELIRQLQQQSASADSPPSTASASLSNNLQVAPSSNALPGRWVRRYFMTKPGQKIITCYRSIDETAVMETINLEHCFSVVPDDRNAAEIANGAMSSLSISAPATPEKGGASSSISSSSSGSGSSSSSSSSSSNNSMARSASNNKNQSFGFKLVGVNGEWNLRVDNARDYDGWMSCIRIKLQAIKDAKEQQRRLEEERDRLAQQSAKEESERIELEARLAKERKEAEERERREAEERALEAIRQAREDRIRQLHPKRTNIVQEILATEQSYVSDLLMVVDLFMKPLRASIDSAKPIVSNTDLRKIFPDIETILSVNKQLLSDLRERVDGWSPTQKIGDVFLKVVVYLKVYTGFVSNFPLAADTINRLMDSSVPFKTFLKEVEAKPECKRLTLSQHLLTPVQRLPRYVLLLEDLAKRTDPEHVDYQDITNALKQMKELAQFVNETKRQAEIRALMVSIQKDVKKLPEGFEVVQPQRRLISETSFNLLELANSKARTYTVTHTIIPYLFSDIVLVVKRKKKNNGNVDSFQGKAPVNEVQFVDLPDVGDATNILQLSVDAQTMILQASSKRIKDEWLNHLKEVQKSA